MSTDNGPVRCGVGREHAVAQFLRNVRSMVERDPQKHDDAVTGGKLATVAASIRGRLNADRLQ